MSSDPSSHKSSMDDDDANGPLDDATNLEVGGVISELQLLMPAR